MYGSHNHNNVLEGERFQSWMQRQESRAHITSPHRTAGMSPRPHCNLRETLLCPVWDKVAVRHPHRFSWVPPLGCQDQAGEVEKWPRPILCKDQGRQGFTVDKEVFGLIFSSPGQETSPRAYPLGIRAHPAAWSIRSSETDWMTGTPWTTNVSQVRRLTYQATGSLASRSPHDGTLLMLEHR